MKRGILVRCGRWWIAVAMLAAVWLAACRPQEQSPAVAETTVQTTPVQAKEQIETPRDEGVAAIPGITKENFPRLDGSTSTIPLSQLIACRVLGLRGELRRTLPSGYSNQSPLALVFPLDTDPLKLEEFTRLQPYHRRTHEAYMRLIQGQADMIFVASEPSPDELKAAQTNKVKLDVRPIALDALVFIVNKANPVKSLTLEQIRAIFTGKTTLWRPLGGADFPIKVFTRNQNSGSQELMEKLVLQNQKLAAGDDVTLVTEMGAVIQRVATNRHAIGYSIFYYERVMNPTAQNRQVAINGVLPSKQAIADRSYPLVAPVYVVTRQDVKAGSPTAKLRDWLLSADGQKLVASSGYVPVEP